MATLEQAVKEAESDIIEFLLAKELQGEEYDYTLDFSYIKPSFIFLNDQNHSVPIGALLGSLVGSRQDKIVDALRVIEVMVETDQIDIREVNGNWIVDPVCIDFEQDASLGVSKEPIQKEHNTVFCGKVIHKPQPTRVDHLQSLNNIKFRLNEQFLQKFPEIPVEVPFKKTLPALLDSIDHTIYVDHKYDTRGRTYCAGHINYQGTEWEKCLLQFKKEEVISNQGYENLKLYKQGLKPTEEYLNFVADQAYFEGTTGIFIGADASASGMQIIAALFACHKTAANVGLLDVNNDAYTVASNNVQFNLPAGVDKRSIFKQCCMQHSYGGTKTPLSLLGEDNYENFIDTMWNIFPAIQEYLSIIQSIYYKTPVFSWTLPDGFEVYQPVIETKNVEFHLPNDKEVVFGYAYKTLIEREQGLEMAANVVHSVDGYVARELIYRAAQGNSFITEDFKKKLDIAISHSTNTKEATVFSLYRLLVTPTNCWALLGKEFLTKAKAYITRIEAFKDFSPFTVISIHDDFKSHPNHLHIVKWLYLEILADIADGDLLREIMMEINPNIKVSIKRDGQLFAHELRHQRANGNSKGLS